jgi:hypothetical protein
VLVWAERGQQRGVDPGEVTQIGHHDDGTAARGEGGGDRGGDLGGPPGSGQGGPDGARRGSRVQRIKERTATVVVGPPAGHRPGRRLRGLCGCRGLRPGVAGRDGEAEYVGDAAGVAVGDRPGQGRDGRGEHGLGRHQLGQPGEAASVLGLLRTLEQEAVNEPAGEADPHADAGLGGSVEVGRHGIVERSVEVRQGDVDGHPGDGADVGQRWRFGHRPARGTPSRSLEQGELLAGTVGHPRRHTLISAETAVTTPPLSTAAQLTTFGRRGVATIGVHAC